MAARHENKGRAAGSTFWLRRFFVSCRLMPTVTASSPWQPGIEGRERHVRNCSHCRGEHSRIGERLGRHLLKRQIRPYEQPFSTAVVWRLANRDRHGHWPTHSSSSAAGVSSANRTADRKHGGAVDLRIQGYLSCLRPGEEIELLR